MGSKTSIYVSSDTSIKVKKSIICPKMTTLEKLIATANENSKPCTKPGCGSTVVSRKADALSAWVCNRCGGPAQMSPARTEAETMILSIIEEEDGAMKDPQFELFRRGLTVRLLNNFTQRFKCWDWPTWRVVRDIVIPATTKRRERYFEILERDHPAECGPPGAFISHAWAAKWGALVGAASYGCSDGDRRVWVDVFAVRQWPGSPIDLDFRSVVERCGSLILAISHEVIEEADLNSRNIPIYRTTGNSFSTLLDAGVRRKLPLARSWCLVELGAAYRAQKSMVAVAGKSVVGKASAEKHLSKLLAVDTAGHGWTPGREFAVSPFGLVEVLSSLTWMEDAEASSEVDRNRIREEVQRSIGFSEFNFTVHAALISASLDAAEADIVLPLICDNDDRILRERAATHHDKPRLLAAFVHAGLEQAVKVLIDEFNYDFEDRSMPALWAACRVGQLRVAHMLVDEYHASVEARAGNGMTPLAAAAGILHTNTVKFLLSRGADADARARLGRTAMMAAAIQGGTNILTVLKQAGADTEIVDNEGQTALTYAIDGLHVDAVDLLISTCGANVNLQSGPERFSPLHWASNRGSSDIVKLLIDCGANIEARAADGTRPLITAALNGHDNIVTQLIDAGADAKATNDSGWSIVDCAMVEGHQHVLRAIAARVDLKTIPSYRLNRP